MKNHLSKFLTLALLMSLTACGGGKKSPSISDSSSVSSSETSQEQSLDGSSSEQSSSEGSSSESGSSSSSSEDEDGKIYDPNLYYDGYYANIGSWSNSEELKQKLFNRIRDGFTGITYSDQNWESNQYTEQDLTDFTKLDVVYSQTNFDKNDTYKNGKGWQREHAFCATLMTGYATGNATDIRSSGTSRATDFHNLFASYGAGNGARGNKNFGISDKDNLTPSVAVLGDFTADVRNFEPNDVDKGKLARAIFYMGVMYSVEEESNISINFTYNDGSSHTKSFTVPAKYKPLQIVEDYVSYSQITLTNFCSGTGSYDSEGNTYEALRKQYYGKEDAIDISKLSDADYIAEYAKAYSDYRYNDCQFAIGNLSTLLSWNSFPVTRLEMQHNESVYSHIFSIRETAQGNRNPFVDYPGLVEYVYGSKKDQAGDIKYLVPSEYKLNTGNKDVYGYALTSYKTSYNVGDTLTKDDYSLLRVNNDFSTQEMDFTNTNPDYTFVNSDVGNKVISINTPKNVLQYEVTVNGEKQGVDACNFHDYLTPDDPLNDYREKGTGNVYQHSDKENIMTLTNEDEDKDPENMDWAFYWKNGRLVTLTADNGATFGAQNKGTTNQPCEEIYLKSQDTYKVDAIYFLANTGSGKSYTYNIFVDDELVKTGTIVHTNAPEMYGVTLSEAIEGKVKIQFTDINGTLILKAFGINIVK